MQQHKYSEITQSRALAVFIQHSIIFSDETQITLQQDKVQLKKNNRSDSAVLKQTQLYTTSA